MINISEKLKLTKKQLQVLQAIAKSHPYFPDLALDDYTFNNKIYRAEDKLLYADLIERGIITRNKNCLFLNKSIAKKYWQDLIYTIPVELVPNINREFLENSPLENLKSAYTTLTSSSPDKLSREKIITTILSYFENKGEEKMEKETKKLTPAMAAKENNISPSTFRKMLRKLYGKSEGNWELNQDKVNAVLKALDEHRKEVAAGRAERMNKLQEARKKAQATKAKPVTAKKAPAKK